MYHIPGKLVVASGYVLEQMVETMVKVGMAVKPALIEVVLPVPRYLKTCCDEHGQGKSEEQLEEERERVIKAVMSMKREVSQLLGKMNMRNVVLVSPLEVLLTKGVTVEKVRKVMEDGVHLTEESLEKVLDAVIQRAEEFFVAKKRGPTERVDMGQKRARMASAGEGSSRGGWRGGRGAGGGRGRNHTVY